MIITFVTSCRHIFAFDFLFGQLSRRLIYETPREISDASRGSRRLDFEWKEYDFYLTS